MPLMLIAVLTLLMMQLQSFQKTIMVLLTSPLGLIGVAFILLTWNVPFGFVANLGVIALFGMRRGSASRSRLKLDGKREHEYSRVKREGIRVERVCFRLW